MGIRGLTGWIQWAAPTTIKGDISPFRAITKFAALRSATTQCHYAVPKESINTDLYH